MRNILFMSHYLYILYSPKFDKYYVGETKDIDVRLFSHNNTDRNTFTSKYRPWQLEVLFSVEDRGVARLK